jgi:glycogen debranching enzyme
VGPHDTAIAVSGLRRAGCHEEANRVAAALLAAAECFGGRLPELFAGLTPGDLAKPVPYPAACSPQAWASASPLLLVRALLGLEPDIPSHRVQLDPSLPEGASQLRIERLPVGGQRLTVEVEGDAMAVRGLPRGFSVVRPS